MLSKPFALFFIGLGLISSPIHADLSEGPWVLSATIAAGQLSSMNSSLKVSDIETDTLHQTKNPHFTQWGLGIGYEIFFHHNPTSQLTWFESVTPKLNFYHFSTQLHGNVYQFQLSQFNNYQYTLNLNSNRLMLDGDLTVAAWNKSRLFIIGGVGASWNELTYFDTPYPGVVNGQIELNRNTKTSLAGEIGIGVAIEVYKHTELFCQYLYTYLGKAQTGSHGSVYVYTGALSPIQVTPAHFSLNAQLLSLGLNIKLRD